LSGKRAFTVKKRTGAYSRAPDVFREETMFLRKGVLAIAIACTALPLAAATRSNVTIGAPVILVDALDPDPAAPPAYFEGGHWVEEFQHHLSPAPVGPETAGNATITANDDLSVGGRTDGPGSRYIVVGDRYAPSFTFTATPNTRVTVQAPYRLEAAITGEPTNPEDPARVHASFELMVVAFNNFVVDGNGALSYDLLAIENDSAQLQATLDDARTSADPESAEGMVSVSFDNLSDQEAVFAFRGEMVAWGASPVVSHAPEPAGVAMMLAGLGVVGFVAGRRRRATGAPRLA
jgi:hypothetical protein